jgi:RHS repeat-associated protein
LYDPWGVPKADTYPDINFSGLGSPAAFTSYTYDEVLELYFAQTRFYDSADRRFTQEDTIREGANWYAYCGNSPVGREFGTCNLRDFMA